MATHLGDVHHGVTAQGSRRSQVVEAQQGGYDTVLIDATDHGAVYEEDHTIFVHGDAWMRERDGWSGMNLC